MICDNIACGCAVISDTLTMSGSGTPADPWRLEQAEFTDIATLQVDVANINATLATLPGTYVDVTGDVMTGALFITSTSGRTLSLKGLDDAPYVEFRDSAGTRCGFLQGQPTGGSAPGVRLASDSADPIRLYSGADRVIVDGTTALFYKAATNIATQGVEANVAGALWVTRIATNGPNYISNKSGATANIDGAVHMEIMSAGTQIGRIHRVTSSTSAYTGTSDRDLKENFVPIDDELSLLWMRTVEPTFFNWKDTPDDTTVGYVAQDVAEAWPNAVVNGVVSPGHGNVEDRTWDEDGNETTPYEVWRPWGVDHGRLTPFLHSAMQALDRVVTAQAARIDALETQVADLLARLDAVEAIVKPK